MNKEIKQKWLNALRSGEYKQGTGCLRSGNEFCCLGVLTDIYSKETGNGNWNDSGGFTLQVGADPNSNCYKEYTEILPVFVRDWADLDACDPLVEAYDRDGDEIEQQLSAINDEGRLFSEIADLIEEQL